MSRAARPARPGWIRGRREREVAHRNISFFARYAFGTGPLVTLNAFSMGAWAAGMNMSLGMTRHGIVKSIGPDVDKLLSTLTYLGPSYRFLISGYPPFLKHLLDEGERREFPWADYEVHGLVGGEGMTEELRDVLLERFGRSTRATARPISRSAWPSRPSASPYVGSPAAGRMSVRRYSGETLASRWSSIQPVDPLPRGQRDRRDLYGLGSTFSRLASLQRPRRGGVIEFTHVRDRLAAFGFDIEALGAAEEAVGPRGPCPGPRSIPLPFLWVNGRRDATISVMGANIYPEDIETLVYRDATLVPRLHSFLLSVMDDESGVPRPMVALQVGRPGRHRRFVAHSGWPTSSGTG